MITRSIKLQMTLLALVAVVGCSSFAATFDQVNQLYDQGKFADAKKGYQELLATGTTSANLYFNLGNAEYRLGETGSAILAYERSLALEPSQPEARANLKFVRDHSGARTLQPAWWEKVILPWTVPAYSIAAAVCLWAAVFAFFAMWRWRAGAAVSLWFLAFAGLLGAAYCGAALWKANQDLQIGIVTSKEAVARLSPADRAAIAETLPAGSQVRYLRERGDWIYCELPSQGRGWIAAANISKLRPSI